MQRGNAWRSRDCRKEDRGEEGIADAGPVKRAVERVAAGDLLRSDVLVFAVAVAVELRAAVGLRIVLIAEAAGPGEERANGRAVARDLDIGVENIGLVKGEGLRDLRASVCVLEGQSRRAQQDVPVAEGT